MLYFPAIHYTIGSLFWNGLKRINLTHVRLLERESFEKIRTADLQEALRRLEQKQY